MKDKLPEEFINLPNNKKILVIVGPTASGKTALALKLAKKYNGELLSADSRQIYRGMDIGTGKDLPVSAKCKVQSAKLKLKIQKLINLKLNFITYEVSGIPVWGLDLINPDESFSVAQWMELAKLIIADIQKRNKLVILGGGTGFWVKALLEGIEWGRVKPNLEFRIQNSELTFEKLQKILKQYPKKFWESLTLSDWKNKRRLIRRIEVAEFIKNNPKTNVVIRGIDKNIKVKIISLDTEIYALRRKIYERIEKRLKQGLLEEIKSLLNKGYTFSDLGMNTLGYKEFKEYFESGTNDPKLLQGAAERWKGDELDYARRQIVWNKKYFKELSS